MSTKKSEKEAALDRKIAEIRAKEETRKKRFAEIEADRASAGPSPVAKSPSPKHECTKNVKVPSKSPALPSTRLNERDLRARLSNGNTNDKPEESKPDERWKPNQFQKKQSKTQTKPTEKIAQPVREWDRNKPGPDDREPVPYNSEKKPATKPNRRSPDKSKPYLKEPSFDDVINMRITSNGHERTITADNQGPKSVKVKQVDNRKAKQQHDDIKKSSKPKTKQVKPDRSVKSPKPAIIRLDEGSIVGSDSESIRNQDKTDNTKILNIAKQAPNNQSPEEVWTNDDDEGWEDCDDDDETTGSSNTSPVKEKIEPNKQDDIAPIASHTKIVDETPKSDDGVLPEATNVNAKKEENNQEPAAVRSGLRTESLDRIEREMVEKMTRNIDEIEAELDKDSRDAEIDEILKVCC